MLRTLFLCFVVSFLVITSGCSRDPYQDDIECSRDRSSWDTEGHNECMEDRGWTPENIHEPLFDRPAGEIQEEQPLLPLDFEPDRENFRS